VARSYPMFRSSSVARSHALFLSNSLACRIKRLPTVQNGISSSKSGLGEG
jgi:hypothetical protein